MLPKIAAALFPRLFRQLHVRSWQLPTAPNGWLGVSLPFPCVLKVATLDPHISNWTTLNVHLHVPISTNCDAPAAKEFADSLAISVRHIEDSVSEARIESTFNSESGLSVVTHEPPSRIPELIVEIPGLHNLSIELRHGKICLCDTIEGELRISTDTATVDINKLRSSKAVIETRHGDIVAQVLQGDISMKSESGNVTLTRAQGNSINIQTGGSIHASVMYGGNLRLCSKGNLRIDAVHGDTEISAANATISAVQGSLLMRCSGGAHLALADAGEKQIEIDAAGDVQLGTQRSIRTHFNLDSDDIKDEIGVLSEDSECEIDDSVRSTVTVRTKGKITLREEQWGGRMVSAGKECDG